MTPGKLSHVARLWNRFRDLDVVAERCGEDRKTVESWLRNRRGYPGQISAGARREAPREGASWTAHGPAAKVSVKSIAFLERRFEWERD